jgi:hypothetical protein
MVGGNSSFIGYLIGSFNTLKIYRLYLSFNRAIAGIEAASLINSPIDVVFRALIIDLTYLFISR